MNKQRILHKIAFSGIILILVLVIIYSGLQILKSTVFVNEREESKAPSKTITRNNIEYFPRQDITTLLVMGIDQDGPVVSSNSYNNKGAADAVILLVFDEKNKETNILCLNRDTIVEMPILGIGGRKAGTVVQQLALSHTYGSGLEDSCENTRETVSNLLYGIYIDYYLALNMDAIPVINDAVGGVKVNVTEDFSLVDPTIEKGEMLLKGKQAINFIRTRKDVGNQMNISRIERQKEYMNGFLDAFRAAVDKSSSVTLDIYDSVSDYMVTDCSATVLSSSIDRYADYALKDIISPEGENVLGEQYYEFYLDEEKLDELILELFYAPKK